MKRSTILAITLVVFVFVTAAVAYAATATAPVRVSGPDYRGSIQSTVTLEEPGEVRLVRSAFRHPEFARATIQVPAGVTTISAVCVITSLPFRWWVEVDGVQVGPAKEHRCR